MLTLAFDVFDVFAVCYFWLNYQSSNVNDVQECPMYNV